MNSHTLIGSKLAISGNVDKDLSDIGELLQYRTFMSNTSSISQPMLVNL